MDMHSAYTHPQVCVLLELVYNDRLLCIYLLC